MYQCMHCGNVYAGPNGFRPCGCTDDKIVERAREITMRRYWFTVSGEGNFPFIMLTRSQAWPATVADAQKVYMAAPTQATEQRISFFSDKPLENIDYVEWRGNKWPITSAGEKSR